MAFYKKQSFIGGKWANKSDLFDRKVAQAKIVSETNPEQSQYKDKKGNLQSQEVCRVQFEGENESLKVSLNNATINALVDAFGEDSSQWQAHNLTVEIIKLPGKKFPLYLIPEGYQRVEDENGYSIIVKIGEQPTDVIAQADAEEISVDNMPF